MSKSYEDMKALIASLSDEETKKTMDKLLSDINKEKGTALSDLNTYKNKASQLEGDVKTLAELTKILKEQGLEVKSPTDVIALAKNLNLNMDTNQTVDAYKQIMDEQKKELDKVKKDLTDFKVKETVIPLLERAKSEYKDKDGKPIKFIESFIDKTSLLKDLDISNEIVINQKIKHILEDGINKQNIFMVENGLQPTGVPVHNVRTPDVGITSSDGINLQSLQKTFVDGGANVNSLAQLFGQLEQPKTI